VRAFSLVEVLAVLVIVSILVAVSVPLVGEVRGRARDSVSSGNLRTHAQAITMYTADFADGFPHFTKRGFASTTLEGGGIQLAGVSYFDAHQTWHIALADSYYLASVTADAFFPPGYPREDGDGWPFYTPYYYPCAFIAAPEYWNELTRMGPSQYRGTRIDEVLFPSAKVLVVQGWPFRRIVIDPDDNMRTRLPVSSVDGSVRALRWNERENGYERGDGYQFQNDGAIHYIDWPRLLHTIDGVRGRDVH